MKFKELLLREEIVSRTLGPLFCLGSASSVPCISVFCAIWGTVLEDIGCWFSYILDPAFDVFGRWLQLFVYGSVSVACLGQRFSCLSRAAFQLLV
jgi:hypothetical protein